MSYVAQEESSAASSADAATTLAVGGLQGQLQTALNALQQLRRTLCGPSRGAEKLGK
ncbi:hypothetical protein SARC_17511, partial [Sphaeroforma arctica JP610]